MDGRPFDDISVQEIIDEAQVSRSSFYARFPSKADVVPHMYRSYVDRANALLDEAASLECDDLDPHALVEQLIRSYVTFISRFDQMLASFELADLGSRHHRTRDRITERVSELYLARVGLPNDRSMRDAVTFITRSTAAVLMRAKSGPNGFARALDFDDERLITEVTLMANCYLDEARRRCDPMASPARRDWRVQS